MLIDEIRAIVGADEYQAFLKRGFGDGCNVAILRHGQSVVSGIDAPDSVHDFQPVPIPAAGQIRTDGGPGITPVIAAMAFLGAEV